jgi:nicotinamide riboside kinase
MADMNSESRGRVSNNFIDIDPISTRFWCESYLWLYFNGKQGER